MMNPASESRVSSRMSVSVKWYDVAKGHGFLDPGDESSDIFCSRAVLDAVGMGTLLAGATVDCDIEEGLRGPKATRIHAIDFSTATEEAPMPAASPLDDDPEALEPEVELAEGQLRAIVKWFLPIKGYGFLEPEDGSADLFCHLSAVRESGHDTLPQGAAVICEIVQGDRGPQVSRVLSVEPPAVMTGPANYARPRYTPRDYGRHDDALPKVDLEFQGTVKFFDPTRGFGFVIPDGGGREVFVHSSVLLRSGLSDLQPGERVNVRAGQAPRGLQATEIEPI